MKISIVTVAYNCHNMIRRTIQSVIEQTFQNIEYMIVDGGSSDGTYSIILQYVQENKIMKSISEPDKGIYNAMNKALGYLSGDYVLFLNAGDYFYSKEVLDHFADFISRHDKPDIVYGNAVFYTDRYTVIEERKNFDRGLIIRAKGVCHQSILAKIALFEEYKFDESFLYCADRDWLYYMYFKRKRLLHMDEWVVYYEANGFSSQKDAQKDIMQEAYKIQKKYCIYYYYINRIRIILIKIRNWLR